MTITSEYRARPTLVRLGLLFLLVLGNWPALTGASNVWRVGPGRTLPAPSWAARVAGDGDVVEIEAATYDGDVAVWPQNDLTLRGVGGRPHLRANGQIAQGKGIWVFQGKNTLVENIELSGARAPSKNGAGIRLDAPGLTVRRSYFHDNENGILGGGGDGEVVIEHSEFARNGHGDGQSHNIYINRVKTFTLRGSYSHGARTGHNVKSRARTSFLLHNRLMDESHGTSSYAVDLPDGGLAYLIGNLIQQGPMNDNRTLVAYGAEGLRHDTNELYVVNNTLVNDDRTGGVFIYTASRTSAVRILNNVFEGRGTILVGPGSLSHNLRRRARLLDRRGYDYRLRGTSAAIDRGTAPGSAHGFSLTPAAQYVHSAAEEDRPRRGRLDVGAYEYAGGRAP